MHNHLSDNPVTPLLSRRQRHAGIAVGASAAMALLFGTAGLAELGGALWRGVPLPADVDRVFWPMVVVFAIVYPLLRLRFDGEFWAVLGTGRAAEELLATPLAPTDFLSGCFRYSLRSSATPLVAAWALFLAGWACLLGLGTALRGSTALLVLAWPLSSLCLLWLMTPAVSHWTLGGKAPRGGWTRCVSLVAWVGLGGVLACSCGAGFPAQTYLVTLVVAVVLAGWDRRRAVCLMTSLSAGPQTPGARHRREVRGLRPPTQNPIVVRDWIMQARRHHPLILLLKRHGVLLVLAAAVVLAAPGPDALLTLGVMFVAVQTMRTAVSTALAVRSEREARTLEPLASTCLRPSQVADGFVFASAYTVIVQNVLAVPVALAAARFAFPGTIVLAGCLLVISTVAAGYAGFVVGVTARSRQETVAGSLLAIPSVAAICIWVTFVPMFGSTGGATPPPLPSAGLAAVVVSLAVIALLVVSRSVSMVYLRRAIAEPLRALNRGSAQRA